MSPTIVYLVDRELQKVRDRIRTRLNDLQNTPDPGPRLALLSELESLVEKANDLALVAETYS